jgi:chaperonin GroEL (HSP60 family)
VGGTQDEEVGDGTTSVIILAGELLQVHKTVQYSTVQYSNCERGSQTLALASEPQAHEGAQRAQ